MAYVNWIFGKDGALLQASARGNVQLVSELIALGANVNAQSPNGYTPLHRATQNGYLDVAKLLVDNGAQVNTMTGDNVSPIQLASENGHKDIMEFLSK